MSGNRSLGAFENEPPNGPREVDAIRPRRPESPRLLRELADRMDPSEARASRAPGLSPVEQAMRRNAPDLAGGTEAEILEAELRDRAHLDARWPRPRVVALILVMTLAFAVPEATARLLVWMLILFLVSAIAVGPERARDGAGFLGFRFLSLWKHELVVVERLLDRLLPRTQ